MRATATDGAGRAKAMGLGLSLALHAVLFVLPHELPEPEPEERVLDVAFVPRGDPTKPIGPPRGVPTPSPEVAVRAQPRRLPVLPAPTTPPAPTGDRPLPSPVPAPPSPAPAPLSFRDFERSQRSSFLPRGALDGTGGGALDGGSEALVSRGRDRCQPRPGRRFEVLYLLFDSSGSMSSTGRAQALACANQYVRAAIGSQASIVVANFARDVRFTGPTTSSFDVEAALREPTDGRATILPSRELQPFLDAAPGAISELVIVSDGMFLTTPEILIWYQYFLELHDENRGTMYTVGTPGYRPSVAELRGIGFDVFVYEQIRRTAER
jgi:hypothetical protein